MVVKFSGPVNQDPAIINLLENMPDEVKASFSELQLAHLRNAVSTRQWQHHAIDVRGTIPWFSSRFYYVFIAGKNQRQLTRQALGHRRLLKAMLLTAFLSLSTLLGLLLLYGLKSALGINLFEGFSLGIWQWFKQL